MVHLDSNPAEKRIIDFVAANVAPDYDVKVGAVGLGDSTQINSAISDGRHAGTIFQHRHWLQQVLDANPGFTRGVAHPSDLLSPMDQVTRRTVLGLAGGLAAMLAGCSSGAPAARGDDRAMRFTYGDQLSQYAEISLPSGSAPAPVVVIIHGGYWSSSYGLELGRPLAVDLAGRGYAAVNVEYRRVGEGGGWPQTGQDVAAAVDAMRTQAPGRLDLTRVVALGHSAGGQLAGFLAARRGAAVELTGAVLQAGVLDLVGGAKAGLGGGAVESFLGGSPTEKPEVYAEASPLALVPLGVPTVCVHGTSDSLVPIEQSQHFVDAARTAGDRTELQTFDGDHFDLITVGTKAWDLCVDGIRRLTGT